MTKKILIDARQSDETRVVLLNNNKIEDFDYETSHRKQLKGNIYLARVTRVEPSLQAAFVEYGGNRQGFLAFSEIHPDYYRIPVEDREKLLAEEADRVASDRDDDDAGESPDAESAETENDDAAEAIAADANAEETISADISDALDEDQAHAKDAPADDHAEEDSHGDGDDDEREARRRFSRISRHYKIQEVISRRQIMLIQVVKEERGNKGAALTTYLSLAGRYCVLMPNTLHGGGVSRKISNPADRKKLKTIVNSLEVPKGMAVIVRTAGSKRTKAEITRDFTYLMRQWDDIRSLTMESTAPAMIHEEGNLIKRAIRDHYSPDVDEILVEGADAHKAAKTHMKNLMPSHVKKVKSYDDEAHPLFQRYQVETMLSAMHDPQVVLKSGGYLVINQTEALVAIDVNSGRATRERNIEETALKTNLEAAEEIAQQLRQRDLSGLVVIDFIDMESNRNQRQVERKLKDALRNDRARIQVGSISQFGLLEMSRQRLRPSLAESVTNICPHCNGTGRVRSVESAALQVLRSIEAEALKGKSQDLRVFMNSEIALYILNHKRDLIVALESRFSISIALEQDNSLIAPEVRFGDQGEAEAKHQDNNRDNGRRNRRGKPQNDRNRTEQSPNQPSSEDEDTSSADPSSRPKAEDGEASDDDKPRRRRRRGKRGGRRRGRRDGADQHQDGEDQNLSTDDASDSPADEASSPNQQRDDAEDSNAASTKKPRRSRRKSKDADADKTESTAENTQAVVEASEDQPDDKPAAKKAKKATKKAKKAKAKAEAPATTDADADKPQAKKKAKKAKKGKKASSGADSNPVKDKAPQAKGDDQAADQNNPREAASSSAVNVINVNDVAPASKKKGWWS
jgi:ribonuclease E